MNVNEMTELGLMQYQKLMKNKGRFEGLNDFNELAFLHIPLTQGKTATIDSGLLEAISKYTWRAHKGKNTFYAINQGEDNV